MNQEFSERKIEAANLSDETLSTRELSEHERVKRAFILARIALKYHRKSRKRR